MSTDSFFAVMCGGMIALLFGLALAFAGYRLFLILLPIWGFFFGFGLGAQTIMAISPNDAFLATVTSWVVGFIVAAVFAILVYLFYIAAVAIVSFSLGYSATIGLLTALGLPLAGGFIAWIIAVVVGVILAFVVLRFNIQKIVIELATAFLGAGVIVGVFLALFGGLPTSQLIQNPVAAALKASPFWMIVFIVLGAVGLVAQIQNNRSFEAQTYNRMTTTP
jgi:Ni,Fe-hydrogenase I cytochrome b subunit